MGLRERYAHEGPGTLGDAEILALVLGTGVAGTPAIGVARALLDRFGDLRCLQQAEPAELAEVHGVGDARAIRLHAAMQLGHRARRVGPASESVSTPLQAWQHLAPALLGLADEELHGLFLDRRRRPLALRTITRGSDAFTIVDPRQVFRLAVRLGASAVVIAHNHPSGDPEPSAQDADVTDRLARAGRVLGVPVIDHLVITDGGFVSLAERGLLPLTSSGLPLWTH